MSGDENDQNGVNEIMEHSLRSHAITSLYVFICFMVLISSRASLHLSCDFIIRVLQSTQSSKSKIFLQQRQVNYLHRSAGRYSSLKKAALPLLKKQRRCQLTAPHTTVLLIGRFSLHVFSLIVCMYSVSSSAVKL